MAAAFDYFVIFAEMRTGSNFLEANLNAFQGLRCHGEAFNPHLIGYPDATEILGITQETRDRDPQKLLLAIRDEPGVIGGFRFFHDHDPRVIETVLSDPRCAKIILTRNPAESYVSWKIAKQTDLWKITNAKGLKTTRIPFDAKEFEEFLSEIQGFQTFLLNTLQRSGQTPFFVGYEDLQDLDVINGLGTWLGVDEKLPSLDKKLKKQNPEPIEDKVSNYKEMEAALAGFDRFDLSRTPNFEPRR